MNLQQHTCSRELAEEMARLGICQDEPELWFMTYPDGHSVILDHLCYLDEKINVEYAKEFFQNEYERVYGNETKFTIATTLARMMEALPSHVFMVKNDKGEYAFVSGAYVILGADKHLTNAVAKALIAIKKGA